VSISPGKENRLEKGSTARNALSLFYGSSIFAIGDTVRIPSLTAQLKNVRRVE
jgi:hypothetical protein